MTSIDSLETTTFSGRRFRRADLKQIKETVSLFKNLSRHELAFTICENFNWKTERGALKINSALNMLEKLERAGVVQLPELQKTKDKKKNNDVIHSKKSDPGASLCCSIQELGPVKIEPAELSDHSLWNEFIDRYHYLGYRHPFGTHIRYFVRQEATDRILGCLLFSSSAWSLQCRDEWIGWERRHREKRLKYIVNNPTLFITASPKKANAPF